MQYGSPTPTWASFRSETRKEHDDSVKMRKKTPTAALDGLGVLTGWTLAAHAVWITDADMGILPIGNQKRARRLGEDAQEDAYGSARRARRADRLDFGRTCSMDHRRRHGHPSDRKPEKSTTTR